MMAFSVISLALVGYVTNVATDVAVDAANYAALADQDPSAARDRAIERLGTGLMSANLSTVEVGYIGGAEGCEVRSKVTVTVPRFGFIGGFSVVQEIGHAFCENQG